MTQPTQDPRGENYKINDDGTVSAIDPTKPFTYSTLDMYGPTPATKPLDEQIDEILRGIDDELAYTGTYFGTLASLKALIANAEKQARIDEAGRFMPPIADMIPSWEWPCYVCGFDRELLRKHITDRIKELEDSK